MERQAGTLTAASGTGRHTIWALVSIPQCCWDMRDKAMRPCGASGSTRAVFCAPSPCSSVQVLLARSVARHSLETDSLITLRLLALRLHKPHSRLQSRCAGLQRCFAQVYFQERLSAAGCCCLMPPLPREPLDITCKQSQTNQKCRAGVPCGLSPGQRRHRSTSFPEWTWHS